jgi:hypothetical protein
MKSGPITLASASLPARVGGQDASSVDITDLGLAQGSRRGV